MSEIDTLKIDDVSYSIKDATAREAISALNTWKDALFNSIYPVGSVYVTFSSTFDPNSTFSGTWEKCAQGRTLVGVDPSNPLFNDANKLYGSPNAIVPEHTHSVDSNTVVSTSSNGAHTHTWSIKYNEDNSGTKGQDLFGPGRTKTVKYSTSSNGAHTHTVPAHTHTMQKPGNSESVINKNYQPSVAVYMWKRTA